MRKQESLKIETLRQEDSHKCECPKSELCNMMETVEKPLISIRSNVQQFTDTSNSEPANQWEDQCMRCCDGRSVEINRTRLLKRWRRV